MSSRKLLLGLLGLVVAAAWIPLPGAGAANLEAGDALPALKASDVEGALPDTAGKVILLDFWASWCGPCKASFPELDKLHKAYGARGFLVLGISVDESAEDMREFLRNHPVSFPTVRDRAQVLVGAVGVDAMPTSLLVDRRGRIAVIHTGYHGQKTVDELNVEIEKLLGEP